jgi:hypothetical protein
MQKKLYFESHIQSLKQLCIIVCFNVHVFSITSAFTISTYFINTGYLDLSYSRGKFQEKKDVGYKQWFRNKVKHK